MPSPPPPRVYTYLSCLNIHVWLSFRFGSRYSQKCSLFSQKRIKCSRVLSPLPNIQQFSTVWCPLEFKNARTTSIVLQASDFESDENYFRGFLHRYSFPYFLTRFLTDFLHIRHADFNGEHLSYLNKTNWPYYIFAITCPAPLHNTHTQYTMHNTPRKSNNKFMIFKTIYD